MKVGNAEYITEKEVLELFGRRHTFYDTVAIMNSDGNVGQFKLPKPVLNISGEARLYSPEDISRHIESFIHIKACRKKDCITCHDFFKRFRMPKEEMQEFGGMFGDMDDDDDDSGIDDDDDVKDDI